MPTPDPTDLRILCVDDDPAILRLLQVVLTSAGAVVDVATDAASALWKAAAHVPDVLIVDMMMPGTDGVALLKAWRSDPIYTHVPACLLTARDQPLDMMAGYLAGADAYITKPFDPAMLEVVVAELLADRRAVRRQLASTLRP